MARILGVFSAYLRVKRAELTIGWMPNEGPGGGAFPFWLAFGMLICCVWIIARWFRRKTGPSRSTEPYLAVTTRSTIIRVIVALTLMIVAIHIIGIYPVPYTHLRAHETKAKLECRLLLEKKKKKNKQTKNLSPGRSSESSV